MARFAASATRGLDGVGATFDALDRMVEQNRSGAYTEIVYSPTGGKLALMSGQTLQKAFVALPGKATALYTSSGLDHYRHSDWLGSARLTSTPSRTVTSTVAYAPFGETYAQSGTPDPSFTGQNSDTISADYDFLYREYSTQGRWPSPDPAGQSSANPANPQSWNRYAYVLNNPLGLTDPNGLDCAYDEGGGTAWVVSGDCYSETDSGYYFDGTLDPGQTLAMDSNGNMWALVNGQGQCSGDGGCTQVFTDTVTADDTVDVSPTSAFISQLFSWHNFTQSVGDAYNNGYYSCVFNGGGSGSVKNVVAGKAIEEGSAQVLQGTAALQAGAYYHFTDARFTAWGKYSKVLVPKAAAKITAVVEAANAVGWAYTDYELAKGLIVCKPF